MNQASTARSSVASRWWPYLLVVCLSCSPPNPAPDASDASVDARSDASNDIGDDRPCNADLECDDHVFCNGAERCMPGAAGADARGCLTANPAAACSSGQTCDEAARRCTQGSCGSNPDADGDGHRSLACGGDDCDDNDPNRHPGRAEVCVFDRDAGARVDPTHDEDCDSLTYANAETRDGDQDGDGYIDIACCNRDGSGNDHCGDDCADLHAVDGVPASIGTHIEPGNVHPMQGEICNGVDDDCHGGVDDNVATATYYPDCDGDSFGTPGSAGMTACSGDTMQCNGHRGVTNANDCDDTTAAISICGATTNGALECVASRCALTRCDPGYADCDGRLSNGCEVGTDFDNQNCGACGNVCPRLSECRRGVCGFDAPPGSPPFNPTSDTVLPAGIHYYSTVTIPAGVRVTTNGTGVLEIFASGPIRIDGTIDVSGGPGGSNGGGGFTGDPLRTAGVRLGGGGGVAYPGADGSNVGSGGTFGGGGGSGSGGGGGGGPAGGGGGDGFLSGAGPGGGDITHAAGGHGGNGGGPPYDGANGSASIGVTCNGGGGSIGVAAATDLRVATTFQPGSGGGGGGGSAGASTSGGGGGGGAVLIGSAVSVTIGPTGIVRADGGSTTSTTSCVAGGGSGGVIYLAAPSLSVESGASVSAVGGGAAPTASPGGLGRIRIAVGSACTLAGTLNPPLESGCSPSSGSGIAGRTFVGPYPF